MEVRSLATGEGGGKDGAGSLPGSRPRLRRRLLLVLAALTVVLAASELAIRLLRPRAAAVEHVPAVFASDPRSGYALAPGAADYIERFEYRYPVRINGDGCFDDPIAARPPPGTLRIVALGDSFTAGLHVGRGHTYPDQLEAQLEARLEAQRAAGAGAARRVEVVNFGLPGSGPLEQAALAERALALGPALLLHAFYHNDLSDVREGVLREASHRRHVLFYRDPADLPGLAAEVDARLAGRSLQLWLVERLHLARVAARAWGQATGSTLPALLDNRAARPGVWRPATVLPLEEGQRQALAAIRSIATRSRDHGAGFVFIVIPSRDEAQGGGEDVASPILRALAADRLRVLDLRPAFRAATAAGNQLYWRHDLHCNARGYRLVAGEVAAYLARERLLR